MILTPDNFIYCIDYEPQGYYSCMERGCIDDGICRCFQISDIKINNINLEEISKNLFSEIHSDDRLLKRDKKITSLIYDYDIEIIDKYCINRILTSNKIYKQDLWSYSTMPGYYGEEIQSIHLKNELFDTIYNQIVECLGLQSLRDKIEYILKLEYGYLLDILSDGSYSVQNVDISNIVFGQIKHKEKSKIEKCGNTIIKGVCRLIDKKYHVIDGYHRLSQNLDKKVMIIVIS